jgi:S-adenosylmethionine-dependent methyltransferase
MHRIDGKTVPASMRMLWKPAPANADEVWLERLRRDRTEIVPWLAGLVPLHDARVLEIGSGRGASTFALAEQGAAVTAVEVNPDATAYAQAQLSSADLRATFHELNAAHLDRLAPATFDFVIFWASLEHMTIAERAEAIAFAWELLEDGAPLAIIETPNRLWPTDSHTSRLPFFNWLPDEVAFHYLANSTRQDIRTVFSEPEAELVMFQRLGRGVSYHEFDLALGPSIEPVSCLQIERRSRNLIRRLAWRWSSAGRTERMLRRFAPDRDRAWFQPFLYLALRKEH